jgi:predicted dehydrogenase
MSTSLSPVRWGIIGCGDVAERKSGLPLYQTPGSELVAVMRRDAAKAEDFARRHGVRRWYTNVESLLGDPEVNAIYVATPHYLHKDHSIMAAKAGKAILCEKPMGTSLADAQAVVDLCREQNVPLAVAYYRRYWPDVQKIRVLLQDGAVGRINHVRVQLCDYFGGDPNRRWIVDQQQSGGGALSNAGSHWIDLIRYLIGEVVEVKAYCSYSSGFEVEDTAVLLLKTVSGALIMFSASWVGTSINDFDVVGTEGRILASPLTSGRIALQRRGKEPEYFDLPHSGPAHQEFIADLIPRLQNGQAVSIPGTEAVEAWRIMEAAYKSSVSGDFARIA